MRGTIYVPSDRYDYALSAVVDVLADMQFEHGTVHPSQFHVVARLAVPDVLDRLGLFVASGEHTTLAGGEPGVCYRITADPAVWG